MANMTKMVDGEIVELTDDEQAAYDAQQAAWAAAQPTRDLITRMQALEASTGMTRRQREAVLDVAALKDINDQIAVMRAQLPKG